MRKEIPAITMFYWFFVGFRFWWYFQDAIFKSDFFLLFKSLFNFFGNCFNATSAKTFYEFD